MTRSSLAGYLVCNYLLYLRVSGQFHMACGMLHLFGFQLPETHHHYLLAIGLHRLLATDQHLLEGLHGADRVQPGGLPPQATAAAGGPGGGDGGRYSWSPGCCTPTSRSGCGASGASARPTPCSGASSAYWC